MSIRRKVLASDPRRPSTAGNALHAPVKLGTVPLCPSSCGGGRCEQASSHRTQYPPLHELAHALGISSERFGRDRAEVIVECAAFIVCSGLGLPTDGESVPYLASWGENGALEAITDAAELIDQIAARIEKAAGLWADSSEPDGIAAAAA